jgi:hypothetical protein
MRGQVRHTLLFFIEVHEVDKWKRRLKSEGGMLESTVTWEPGATGIWLNCQRVVSVAAFKFGSCRQRRL